MTTPRRKGTETSETRFLLLDITERIMLEDGYAAVSSRRIAKDAGVTPALVHYYFGTLDDLFLAVLRRRAEQQFERQQRVLASAQPIRALWSISIEPAGTALLMEFMALANHRKIIRSELAAYAEEFRKAQLEAVHAELEESGLPPVAVLVLIDSIGRTVVMEEALGMETGLAETVELVERHLDRLEGPAEKPPRTRRAAASRRSPTARRVVRDGGGGAEGPRRSPGR